jgi:EmrB/QacA subfamily drug resistance transporter
MTAPEIEGSVAPSVDPKRWFALVVIAVSQLMIVLDASIVNIALPSAQHALHISTANRQWVVTAYTLSFGGLLLLGGRVADFLGRKRVFVAGLLGFALFSAVGGLAPDAALLFVARAAQGAFAALMAPAALALITVTFTEPRERATAFGVYGGISGGGAAIGLIAGGLLTQYASWRWCLLVNTPVAIATAVAALVVVRESKVDARARYDIPGAVTITAGTLAIVYGFTKAETNGWASGATVGLLVAAVALLAVFVVIELRSESPLLPLRVVLERNRGGSFLASLLVGAALFGMFLLLTYYFQGVLGYSALKTGAAFLPFSGGIIGAAGLASQVLPRVGPRNLMAAGMTIGTGGLVWLATLQSTGGYLVHILPAEVLLSVGMGLVFVPLSSSALIGVREEDAGVASALVNTTQQVGGSLGTALLNTLAASGLAAYVASHHSHSVAVQRAAATHGFSVAFVLSVVLLAVGAVAVGLLVRAGNDELPVDAAPAVA